MNDYGLFNITYNVISQTANGVGGGIAFFAKSAHLSQYTTTSSGNRANAGGNDYAFEVTSTADNNNNPSANGPSGIAIYTGGSGSLRNAITYAQNYMNGNSNNHSMAIMLPNAQTYHLTTQQPLSTAVPNGDILTIIGTDGIFDHPGR